MCLLCVDGRFSQILSQMCNCLFGNIIHYLTCCWSAYPKHLCKCLVFTITGQPPNSHSNSFSTEIVCLKLVLCMAMWVCNSLHITVNDYETFANFLSTSSFQINYVEQHPTILYHEACTKCYNECMFNETCQLPLSNSYTVNKFIAMY